MDNLKIKYEILCLGVGGTGTYFLKELSRELATSNDLQKKIHKLVICDGDTVEAKNLSRQSFITDDIGRNKAVCFAEALNERDSLDWQAYPYYLLSEDELKNLFSEFDKELTKDLTSITIPIIVGCVDNHGARLVCERFFHDAKNCIYIDSANEFENGELVIASKMNGKVFGPCRSFYFPELLTGDTRNREEISCEELNHVQPQHITINMMAGSTLLNAINRIFNNKIDCGVYYFSTNFDKNVKCGFMEYKGEAC